MFFINEVLAGEIIAGTTEKAPNFQNFTASLVPLLIFVGIFYFLLIRPQQKKQKEHEKEIALLKPNDKVLTAGGIFANIVKVKENTLILNISEGVEIEVLSSTVSLAKDFEKKPIKEKSIIKEKETNKEKIKK